MKRSTVCRVIGTMLLVLGVVFGATVSPVPAEASAASAASCNVEIGRTYKNGNYVVGYGSLSQGCASDSLAWLEIQRWTGFSWDDGPLVYFRGPGHDQYITRNCYGWGTQTWRTTIQARRIDGSLLFKESRLRVYCGQ